MREFFGFVCKLGAVFVAAVAVITALLLAFGLEAGPLWLAVLSGGLSSAVLLYGLGALLERRVW